MCLEKSQIKPTSDFCPIQLFTNPFRNEIRNIDKNNFGSFENEKIETNSKDDDDEEDSTQRYYSGSKEWEWSLKLFSTSKKKNFY